MSLDLDQLEKDVFSAHSRGNGGKLVAPAALARNIRPLIAELRASRKVVEAARKVDELQGWDESGTTTTPRFAELHAALRALSTINVVRTQESE